MKHFLIFILLTTLAHRVWGQTIEEAGALFGSKQYDSALAISKQIISHDKNAVDAYVLAGRSLVGKGNFNDAIEYLEKVKSFSNAPAYAKAWAMCELSLCYYARGDYAKSKPNLLDCIELNATKNVTAAANIRSLRIGFDKLYDTWATKESSHFVFHFQDASLGDYSAFIKRKEAAYDSINSFFKAKLPKKIDYFVWNNTQDAETVLKRPLAFTEPALCLTHTDPKHTAGHEMTHSISYFAVKVVSTNRLISEGVCVYFSLSKNDNIAILKSTNHEPISVVDVWKGNSKLKEEIIYPLGGELVKRLVTNFGREKFMELLEEQSYENARKIYGDQLDTLLNKLEEEIKP